MSYSIIAAIFLATIALSSSVPYSNNERNVLARFYPDFVQLYCPATLKSYVDEEQTIERYQFFFTEKEYLTISEESLTMLYTNVMERTITYHPMPNFEVNGTRYFYRRSSKQNYTVEIELVNAQDRLFREVKQPYRYFYLSSFHRLEYSSQIPIMPYYEVTFICNSSLPTDAPKQAPLLSYIDRSFQYTPRYLLDLPLFGTGKPYQMYAYADIRNNGQKTIVIKGAELIAGDVTLSPKPVDYLRTISSYRSTVGVLFSAYRTGASFTRSLGEDASGTYVYPLSLPSSVALPPRSLKSIQFLTPNVTVQSFAYYSSAFSPVNANGKLFKAYNLTALSHFLPNGRLLLREQGRFIGQTDLPDLSIDETYTMIFGYDADVCYRREVQVLKGDETQDSITYRVKYMFENAKLSRDIRVYFKESFSSFKYFQIENISTSNEKDNLPDLISYGTDLRGYISLPRQGGEKMISYDLITYKYKPTNNVNEQ